MKTNNASGRGTAMIIGVWVVFKFILNTIMNGGLDGGSLFAAIVILVLGYLGIKYTNYALAVILVVVVIMSLFSNIGMLFHISSMVKGLIFLIEGFIDVIAALILCVAPNVREHFTNTISDITGGN